MLFTLIWNNISQNYKENILVSSFISLQILMEIVSDNKIIILFNTKCFVQLNILEILNQKGRGILSVYNV